MCTLVSSLIDLAVDSQMWPVVVPKQMYLPTYNVGGTECMVLSRDDATSWVIYCHGNAVTLADLYASGIPQTIVQNCRCNFVAPTYPSRQHQGQRHDRDVVTAVRGAYDELRRADNSPVYVMGRSIGVGVALAACVHDPPAGLGLVSGFASLKNLVPWPLRWVVNNRFDNLHMMAAMPSVPAFVMHGEKDEVVPVDNARKLATKACHLDIVANMTHTPDMHQVALIGKHMADLMRDVPVPCENHFNLWSPRV